MYLHIYLYVHYSYMLYIYTTQINIGARKENIKSLYMVGNFETVIKFWNMYMTSYINRNLYRQIYTK